MFLPAENTDLGTVDRRRIDKLHLGAARASAARGVRKRWVILNVDGRPHRLQRAIRRRAAGQGRVGDPRDFYRALGLRQLRFGGERFILRKQRIGLGGVAKLDAARHIGADVARGGDAIARDGNFPRRALRVPPCVAQNAGDFQSTERQPLLDLEESGGHRAREGVPLSGQPQRHAGLNFGFIVVA